MLRCEYCGRLAEVTIYGVPYCYECLQTRKPKPPTLGEATSL